jgi:hypothetical protein
MAMAEIEKSSRAYLRQARLFQRVRLAGINTDLSKDDYLLAKQKFREIGFPKWNNPWRLPRAAILREQVCPPVSPWYGPSARMVSARVPSGAVLRSRKCHSMCRRADCPVLCAFSSSDRRDSDDVATLAPARVAAEAQLQFARVKQVKKALIERVMPSAGSTSLGTFDRSSRKCGGSLPRSNGVKASADIFPYAGRAKSL